MGFLRKATWVATGGASGLVVKANSKKERTAKAMEKQVKLQKEQLRLQQQQASREQAGSRPVQAQSAPVAGELERLAALHQAGDLTDDEFKAAKASLLQKPSPAVEATPRISGVVRGYCVRCRKPREFEAEDVVPDGRRRVAQGHCPVCGTTIKRFL